jgi:hypothetical protein
MRRTQKAFDTIPITAAAVLAFVLMFAVSVPLAFAQQATPTVTGVPNPTVRVVHASPDAPAVTVLVDGQPVTENLEFGSATEYVDLPAGDHQVQVIPADGDAAIIDQTVTLDGWTSSILVVTGDLGNIQLQQQAVDNNETDPGQARIRLLNADPQGANLDLAIAGSQDPLVGGTGFPNASDYAAISPGTYDLEVRNADSGGVVTTSPGFTVEAGQVYDLIALGAAEGGQPALLALTTPVAIPCSETLGVGEAVDSCLRVIHASPDAGAVDVYIGESAIAEGLEFGDISEFTAAPNGEQQLRIVAAGQPVDQALVDMTQGLTTGAAGQVLISGATDDLQATIMGVDIRALPANQARVRVIHASPDLDAIDVAVAGDQTPFEGIAFRDASGYVVFDAGSATFQLRENGTDTLLLEAADVPLEAGMAYDIVAIGGSEDGTLQMVVYQANAGTLEGATATPIAAIPAAATTGATPAAAATPVVAVGSTPVTEEAGEATPVATPMS